MNTIRTHERAIAFCAVLAETANVGRACVAVGIGRSTAYEWREADEDFAAMWDRALKVGVTALEDEAKRRAFEGVNKPVVFKGQFTYLYDEVLDDEGNVVRDESGFAKQKPVLDEHGNHKMATVKEYSDTLAIVLLKAHDEKYRDNSKLELSGHLALGSMTDDEIRAELAAFAALGIVPPTNDNDDISDLL
ncbi:MAG: terminase [Alcaligenaceae bacterium]|nr:terminase [Alcaligenaceae bacterium]